MLLALVSVLLVWVKKESCFKLIQTCSQSQQAEVI